MTVFLNPSSLTDDAPGEELPDSYRSLERSGVCVAVVDLRLRVVEASDDFRRELAGREEVVGRQLAEFLHQSSHPAFAHSLDRMVTGRGSPVVERVLVLREDDQMAPAELTAVAVRNHRPMISMILVTLRWDANARPVARTWNRRQHVLSDIDARILEGVAMGMSTINLAAKLYLSRQGVEYHVGKMLRRLKVTNRAALVSRAYATGVLSPGTWPPRVVPDCVKTDNRTTRTTAR
jgi:DNA-binding CsgD family transcriptional regulator